jgi:hypothetical protein
MNSQWCLGVCLMTVSGILYINEQSVMSRWSMMNSEWYLSVCMIINQQYLHVQMMNSQCYIVHK